MIQASDKYWQAIGIPVWRLREVAPAKICQASLLRNAHSEVIASLVAESNSASEESLLAKIAEALGLRLEALELSELITHADKTCVVFGQHSLKQLSAFNIKQTLKLCSLQAMLDNPSLKKSVWEALRFFKQ